MSTHEEDPTMPEVAGESPASALARTAPPAALAPRPGPLPAERDPTAVYLVRLATKAGRRSQASALRALAALVVAPGADPALVPWEALSYGYLRALATLLGERYAPATARRLWAALRGVLEEAANLGLLAEGDLAKVKRIKLRTPEEEPKGRALAAAEVAALEAAGDALERALLAVGLYAGLRRAELVALDVRDVEGLAEGAVTVKVRLGKGRKDRAVPVGERGAAALAPWLGRPGRAAAGPMFPGARGERIGASTISARLEALSKKAGVPLVAPHDLRRTFITTLLDRGADPLQVAKLAGHKSVNTTLRYDRRGDAALREAARKLDREEVKTDAESDH